MKPCCVRAPLQVAPWTAIELLVEQMRAVTRRDGLQSGPKGFSNIGTPSYVSEVCVVLVDLAYTAFL